MNLKEMFEEYRWEDYPEQRKLSDPIENYFDKKGYFRWDLSNIVEKINALINVLQWHEFKLGLTNEEHGCTCHINESATFMYCERKCINCIPTERSVSWHKKEAEMNTKKKK